MTTLSHPDGGETDLVNIMADNGTITINGNLPYPITQPGLYVLTITQVDLGYQNFTFDDTVYTIEYDVVANGFLLEVQSTTIYRDGVAQSAIVFQNSYVSLPVNVFIPVAITTSPVQGMAEDFRIGMYDILPFGEFLNTTRTISYPAMQSANFEVMMFPSTTYQVAFRQIANSNPCYTYDNSTFLVDLETDRYGLVTMTITDDQGIRNAVAFINEYQPERTGITIDFTKQIINFPANSDPTFEFDLDPVDDYPYATIKNSQFTITCLDETTTGEFELEFTQAGTYYYTLTELPGSENNYSYDQSSYLVEVQVIDNDGVLDASAIFYKNSMQTDQIIFTNEYEDEPVATELETAISEPVTIQDPVLPEITEEAGADIHDPIIATGDTSPVGLYAGLMFASLGGLIMIARRT